MSELIKGNLIKGKLTIQNNNGSGTAVVFDGNALPQSGTFHVSKPDDLVLQEIEPGAGKHFITGQIDIKDTAGNVLLSLIPTTFGGWIRVQQGGGIMLMGDKTAEKRIELNASERSLTIHTGVLASQRPTQIKLDAENGIITNGRMKLMADGEIEIPFSMHLEKGQMRLGAEPDGQGNDGSLMIGNSDGKVVIVLDAADRTLHVLDNLRLDKGELRLGSEPNGDGAEGGLRLRSASGVTAVLLQAKDGSLLLRNGQDEETIRLDGENSRIHIHKAAGETISIPGMLRLNNGDLRLGGEPTGGGADGSLRLRNAAGKETIFLDGQQGDILLHNADCAEEFDVVNEAEIEPGTVMVLDDDGRLHPNRTAYCRKVAGVVSGAGAYRPGLVLDKQPGSANRVPLALMGKVFCKVDSQYGAIDIGDLLTTSPTVGHAMKAQDPAQAFGAVLGKALRPLAHGRSLIPILVALQ
ncbi:MAG: hypothetical protein IAE79_09040 [Anaerolinea sp.]|nr:hypothetical protein [Anaerolinea sp.]